ncbi:MAG: nitroreductase family protein [Candidatus Thermoplasmatota archaeon]
MDVKEAIHTRRAYRSLDKFRITDELIDDIANHAKLAPSCFNNQPWRFLFVYDPTLLEKLREALFKGNEWAYDASMIIIVLSKKEYDCIMKDGRAYYHFDTGLASAFLILRATELGLIAHPIAGYNPEKVRLIMGIPDDIEIITLIIIGKHADTIKPVLTQKQVESEKHRPERLPVDRFVYRNTYVKK